MERLTKFNNGMIWFVDHDNNDINLEPYEMHSHHCRLAIQKLSEYENIGTPQECRDLFNYLNAIINIIKIEQQPTSCEYTKLKSFEMIENIIMDFQSKTKEDN